MPKPYPLRSIGGRAFAGRARLRLESKDGLTRVFAMVAPDDDPNTPELEYEVEDVYGLSFTHRGGEVGQAIVQLYGAEATIEPEQVVVVPKTEHYARLTDGCLAFLARPDVNLAAFLIKVGVDLVGEVPQYRKSLGKMLAWATTAYHLAPKKIDALAKFWEANREALLAAPPGTFADGLPPAAEEPKDPPIVAG